MAYWTITHQLHKDASRYTQKGAVNPNRVNQEMVKSNFTVIINKVRYGFDHIYRCLCIYLLHYSSSYILLLRHYNNLQVIQSKCKHIENKVFTYCTAHDRSYLDIKVQQATRKWMINMQKNMEIQNNISRNQSSISHQNTSSNISKNIIESDSNNVIYSLDRCQQALQRITNNILDDVIAQIQTGKIKRERGYDNPTNTLGLSVEAHVQLVVEEITKKKPIKSVIISQNQLSSTNPPTNSSALKTLQKMKQIQIQTQLHRAKIRSIQEKAEAAKRAQEDEMARKEQQQIQYQKSMREQLIQHRIAQFQLKQKEREAQASQWTQFYRQFKKTKPLHVLMEEEFIKKFPNGEQQSQSQSPLKSSIIRPKFSIEQINDHQRMYLMRKEEKQPKTVQINHSIDFGYRSKFYINEAKRYRQGLSEGAQSDQDETKQDNDGEYVEKMKRYSQFVRENYKPKKRNTNSPDNSGKKGPKSQAKAAQGLSRHEQFAKGNEYLLYLKSLKKKRDVEDKLKGLASQQIHKTIESGGKTSRVVTSSLVKMETLSSPIDTTRSHSSRRYKNYLPEVKINQLKTARISNDPKQLRLEAQMLEEKVRCSEQKLQHCDQDMENKIRRKLAIQDQLMEIMRLKAAIITGKRQVDFGYKPAEKDTLKKDNIGLNKDNLGLKKDNIGSIRNGFNQNNIIEGSDSESENETYRQTPMIRFIEERGPNKNDSSLDESSSQD